MLEESRSTAQTTRIAGVFQPVMSARIVPIRLKCMRTKLPLWRGSGWGKRVLPNAGAWRPSKPQCRQRACRPRWPSCHLLQRTPPSPACPWHLGRSHIMLELEMEPCSEPFSHYHGPDPSRSMLKTWQTTRKGCPCAIHSLHRITIAANGLF